MSRAFVKESDQEEPIIIPPRAALPAGVANYVTPNGLQQLQTEARELERSAAELDLEDEDEKRRELTLMNGKLALLNRRIASAQVVDPSQQLKDEIRFGATVKVTDLANKKDQTYQIVGVDEADIKQGKIAFVSPVARALTGLWQGETAELRLGKETKKLTVVSIAY